MSEVYTMDDIDPIRRYKVVTMDGKFKIVKRRRSSMQGFVDMGLAAEALPQNRGLAYEDLIYGGYLTDPLEGSGRDAIYHNLRAYPSLQRIYLLIRSGNFRPPEF